MSLATAIPGRGDNALVWAGQGSLGGLAFGSFCIATAVAPRFTIGATALSAGLLAAGHHEHLAEWADEHFGSKS